MEDCVFCQIAKKIIPTNFVYEDDQIAVFPDKNPSAPVHLLLIPKIHLSDFIDASDALIIKFKNKISELVKENNLTDKGYRIIINGGTAKAIPHLHVHLLGGVSVERKV